MKTCTGCKVEKRTSDFGIDRRSGNFMPRCKDCRNNSTKLWRKSKPDYEKNRYRKTVAETRERHLVRKYGVDLKLYDKLLSAQGGCCAICKSPEKEQFKSVLHVDHCHTTGNVRGLLCRGCNHMLGVVKDNPEILMSAIYYLSNPQAAAEVIKAYMETRP